ncbi:MAG: response regulator [Syntrophomonadaceae bacterium]|nr:response regulator [Syntrophomonadaceae bacterium]
MEDLIQIIGINEQNCTNCHQCIAVCPIKICSDGSGDVVKFNNNLCIGCGRCVEACLKSHRGMIEKSARFIIDDASQLAEDISHKEIAALIAPSAQSSFNLKKLITALRKLGIKYVYDVSLGAEITVACYHEIIGKGSAKTPLIASPCPAIVKYIELNHPGLIEHLAPVGSPAHNLAVYVKSLHPEAELAFFSPCLGKRREFQSQNIIKYNVIYPSLVKLLQDHDINPDLQADGEFDNIVRAGIATNFSTPGGLKDSYLYHYADTPASSIARVEGSIVFENYLRDLEESIKKSSPRLPLLVDILSCEKGCNMGVGCLNKSIGEIEYAVAIRSEQGISDKAANAQLDEFLADVIAKHDFACHDYNDRSSLNRIKIPDKAELQQIFQDMHKVEEKDFRNCAACGYNSCYQMAVAVFNRLNKVENCHLYQEKELRIDTYSLQKSNKELKLARKQAEEANQAKSSFLARMSHEIRTPMNAIIGLSYLALCGNPPASTASYLHKIKDAANNLLRIINDILDFSKIEANKIHLEKLCFNLEEVFDSFSNLIVLKAEEKGLELIIAIDPEIPGALLGDPLRLSQILNNLASNAVKFTDTGEIFISAELIEKKADQATLRFTVKDTGIGLSPRQIEKLFNVFTQADESTTRKFGGTGLGLAICKQLVELMGGEIWVDSIPGEGSSFIFTSSFEIATEPLADRDVGWLDLRKIKALVVDDNDTAREVLADMVKALSIEVTTASSGEEALRCIESTGSDEKPYDLVIIDWKMPGLNGIETAHAIKSREKTSKVPAILMVSAYDIDYAQTNEKIYGIDGFLTKPIKPSVLFDTIVKIFSQERTEEKLRQELEEPEIELPALHSIAGAEVLLVEDNKINQQVATELLMLLGVKVSIAANGYEAVAAVDKKKFDLVLMDIHMPEMDGIEATKRIRGQLQYTDLPIVAMTANAMVGDKEASLAAGMNDHITKPIDPSRLRSTLVKWIKPRNAGEEPYQPPTPVMASENLSFNSINTDRGMKNLGGNIKLYKKILLDFAADNKNVTNEIYNNIVVSDYDKVFIEAHTVKGVAGNIGALTLYEAAAQLETALRNESYDQVASLYLPFSKAMNEILDELQEWAGNQASQPQPLSSNNDRAKSQEIINKLRPLLAEANAEAMGLIIEISEILATPQSAELVDLLVNQIDNMDFEEAVETLNQVCAALDLNRG